MDELCKLGNIVPWENVRCTFRVRQRCWLWGTQSNSLHVEQIHSTCVAFSCDEELMGLEVWELIEPVQQKGVWILCSDPIADLLQIRWPVGVGESYSHRSFEEQKICNYTKQKKKEGITLDCNYYCMRRKWEWEIMEALALVPGVGIESEVGSIASDQEWPQLLCSSISNRWASRSCHILHHNSIDHDRIYGDKFTFMHHVTSISIELIYCAGKGRSRDHCVIIEDNPKSKPLC